MKVMKANILISLLLGAAAWACTDGGQRVTYPAGIELSPHNRARQMRDAGAPASEYMPLQLEALRELREGRSLHDPVAVLSQTGEFYMREGNYVEGVDLMQEAVAHRLAHPEGETREDVVMLGNLANSYAMLDMYPEATAVYREAERMSRRYDNYVLNDLLRFQAENYILAGKLDSAALCYDRAMAAIDLRPIAGNEAMLRAGVRSDKAIMWVENAETFADSLPRAVDYLEEAIATGGRGLLTEKFVLGQALALTGDAARGLPLMESMADSLMAHGQNVMVEYALRQMMEVYGALQLADKAAALYPRFAAFSDSMAMESKATAAIAAEVRYRAARKEAEAAELRAEIAATQRRGLLLGLVAVGAVGVLAWLAVRYRRALRRSREARREALERICRLMESQEELSGRIQELNSQLEAERQHIEPPRLDGSALLPVDEPDFRRRFAALHPAFLPQWRERCPELTRSDELLLMFIYLRQSSDEIALALGISRASLNTARFRLRRKLCLGRGASLEAAVCGSELAPSLS